MTRSTTGLLLLTTALTTACANTTETRTDVVVARTPVKLLPREEAGTIRAKHTVTDGVLSMTLTRTEACEENRVRVTQRSGNTLVTPEPDVREVVGESVGPCQRHVAPQTKLVVEGPPGTVAVTVHTDGDGASTVPFDAGAVRRVTTGSGVDVEKQLDAPR